MGQQKQSQYFQDMEPAQFLCKDDKKAMSKKQEKLHQQQAVMFGYDLIRKNDDDI